MKIDTITNLNNVKFNIYIEHIENGLSYLIAIPEQIQDNCQMVVESYNSGGEQKDNYKDNVLDAIQNKNQLNFLIQAVRSDPVLIPIVPDISGEPDYQQLSKESILKYNGHIKFLDCINDAKKKIELITKKRISNRIFLNGYSASGVFAQRFALIYPEIIDRCLIGGAAGTIPIPTDEIGYPIGIKDYEAIFGTKFDYEKYKNIQFGYYVAENEEREPGNYDINGDRVINSSQIRAPMHDMSYRTPSTPKNIGIKQRNLFGTTMNERYFNAINYYKRCGIKISVIVLRDAEHNSILDSRKNRCFKYLKDQLLRFYKYRQELTPDKINCIDKINESFQEKRLAISNNLEEENER